MKINKYQVDIEKDEDDNFKYKLSKLSLFNLAWITIEYFLTDEAVRKYLKNLNELHIVDWYDYNGKLILEE